MNTKLLIQVYLQIIPTHLALKWNCSSLVIFTILGVAWRKVIFLIQRYLCHFKTYSIFTVKKSEFSGAFWSNVYRKWKDFQKIYVFFSGCRTSMTGKSHKMCLCFTEFSQNLLVFHEICLFYFAYLSLFP